MDKLMVEITKGVRIEIDPAVHEVVGIPVQFAIETTGLNLVFSVKAHTVVGDQKSTIENVLTLRKARR